MTSFLNGRVTLHSGDNRDVLKSIPDCSIDSICTDPPYALVSIIKRFGSPNAAPVNGNAAYQRASAGFMGKQWDTGDTAHAVEFWAECLRVLKPGGHIVAFAGTRTYHRMAVAIEDAGFEIRDQIGWCFGSGFPKSHDVSKGIDRTFGAERPIISEQFRADTGRNDNYGFGENFKVTAPATASAREWQGWGTALKPAWEPICLARKPLSEGTVAANVLRWGTGAINVDGCRVEGAFVSGWSKTGSKESENGSMSGKNYAREPKPDNPVGRWPANVCHDGSAEVVDMFPDTKSGQLLPHHNKSGGSNIGTFQIRNRKDEVGSFGGDSGSAARFFYSAKADSDDRLGSKHPTVKPVDLMQWLCRLITPKGGMILDPFAGTGTTAEAAYREGFSCVLIEREAEYITDIERRMKLILSGPDERIRESVKAKNGDKAIDLGPLFGGLG